MAANGAPTQSNPTQTHFPTPTDPAANTSSITRHDFKVTTRKLPILKAGPIDAMTATLGINPPEMIFGDNFVSIEHLPSGWGIKFDALEALKGVDKTGKEMLQVAYSQEWAQSRENQTDSIKEIHKPFDWSYTTRYLGHPTATTPPTLLSFHPSTDPIPTHLLTLHDPILFFDDVMLYEDELADNGITLLSVKIRVMPARLLLLSRFFMRLDNVLLRLRDTRVYVDFEKTEVIREYLAREESYERVRQGLLGGREDPTSVMREPNKLVEYLPVKEKILEKLELRA